MNTSTKIIIAVASALGLTAIIIAISSSAKAKSTKPDGTNNAKDILSKGAAISDQFDEIYQIAQKVGSDMFTNSNPTQLERTRSAFESNLTYNDANNLILLLNKPSSTWSASEKIMFDTLTKKWKGPDAPKVVVPNKVIPPTAKSVPYDILTDKDFDEKISVLSSWRNALLEKQKKGISGLFQKNIPNENAFNKKFLPISLADIKQYVSLQIKDAKDRDIKGDTIMANIRKKYPTIFNGITKIYSLTGEIANERLQTQ